MSYSPFIIASISSCGVAIPLILNFSTNTLAIPGERNPGRVGPKRMPLNPRYKSASKTSTAFCSYHAISIQMLFLTQEQ